MIESVQKQIEDCLDTLEVNSTYSWDDIEKQYRLLIQRWHPDRNSGENGDIAQSKFIEINSAYKMIRAQYRKNGSIPRHMPPEQKGPLLGIKKSVVVKPALYKNKFVIAMTLSMTTLILIGTMLWSFDAQLTEKNRERAKVEKISTANKIEVTTTTSDQDSAQSTTIIGQSVSELKQ